MKFIPLSQWHKHHPWPTEAGLRWYYFQREINGFDRVVKRVDRRLLIDEAAFFAWVEERNILSRIFKGAAKMAGKDAAKKTGKEAAKQGAKEGAKKEATKVEGQPKPPHERGSVTPANKENGQSTPKNMQKQIDRDQAPKDVIRADPPHTPGERPHVHLKDKSVLCNDGKWKDGKEQPIPKDVQKWFKKNGWGEKKPEKPTIYSKEPKKPSPKDDNSPQ